MSDSDDEESNKPPSRPVPKPPIKQSTPSTSAVASSPTRQAPSLPPKPSSSASLSSSQDIEVVRVDSSNDLDKQNKAPQSKQGPSLKTSTSSLQAETNSEDNVKLPTSPSSPRKKFVVKEGFLSKKGHNRRNWKVRWFILTPEGISYHTKPGIETAKGKIPFTDPNDIEVCKAEGLEFKEKKRNHCFILKIKSKNKSYIVDASSEPELNGWIRTISQVLEGKFKNVDDLFGNASEPPTSEPQLESKEVEETQVFNFVDRPKLKEP